MTSQNPNYHSLETLVKWLNRTEGRDKLCKFLQYVFMLVSCNFKENDFYYLQFDTLSSSIKDARKLFRLFKSIIEYQALVDILLDENDNLLKIFRVLRQVFFFFYWFFDNISIAYKVKLFRGNFKKFNVIASTFWLFSLLLAIPVLYIEYKTNMSSKNAKNNLLDSIKYCFDVLPALRDSNLLERSLKIQVRKEIAALGGMVSASITTYELITQK